MDTDFAEQVLVIAVGAFVTLLVWGAVGWWILAERTGPDAPDSSSERREAATDAHDQAELR